MKTKNSKKMSLLFTAGLIFCLSIFGGCQKDEINRANEDTSLIAGTTWKLAGFGDSKTDSFESAKPSGENTYLLTFNKDGFLVGTTSTNKAEGKFVLSDKDKGVSIVDFSNSTEINELFDGSRYIEAMNQVSSYQVSEEKLFLYYGKSTYLLFQPLKDE